MIRQINVITLFPDIFTAHLNHLPIKRAIQKGELEVKFVNLRDFAIDARGTVDSSVFGGGPGMVLRPEPIYNAVTSIPNWQKAKIVVLTPKGKTFDQHMATVFASLPSLIIVCGRYEGIDQRVIDCLRAEEISIGNYILSGGEIAAMAIIESVARLSGGIDNPKALTFESFTDSKLEHPQYGRPQIWMGRPVPDTLLSGHHKRIAQWKDVHSPTVNRA